jgi:hypothetical protein
MKKKEMALRIKLLENAILDLRYGFPPYGQPMSICLNASSDNERNHPHWLINPAIDYNHEILYLPKEAEKYVDNAKKQPKSP